jgi:hypothetical protein
MGIEPALEAFLEQCSLDLDTLEEAEAVRAKALIREAINFFLVQGVKIGGTYQHFKGPKYMVTGVYRDVDIWARFRVTYLQVDDVTHGGDRPLEEFLGMHGSGVRRFVLVS